LVSELSLANGTAVLGTPFVPSSVAAFSAVQIIRCCFRPWVSAAKPEFDTAWRERVLAGPTEPPYS
jgi:hypothetical protein